MRDDGSNMGFFRQIFAGSWITQGIGVAAELGIADLLAEGPQRVEAWIDSGYGSCVLREPEVAEMVQNAFLYFDGHPRQPPGVQPPCPPAPGRAAAQPGKMR